MHQTAPFNFFQNFEFAPEATQAETKLFQDFEFAPTEAGLPLQVEPTSTIAPRSASEYRDCA